eukprot:g65054.t1
MNFFQTFLAIFLALMTAVVGFIVAGLAFQQLTGRVRSGYEHRGFPSQHIWALILFKAITNVATIVMAFFIPLVHASNLDYYQGPIAFALLYQLSFVIGRVTTIDVLSTLGLFVTMSLTGTRAPRQEFYFRRHRWFMRGLWVVQLSIWVAMVATGKAWVVELSIVVQKLVTTLMMVILNIAYYKLASLLQRPKGTALANRLQIHRRNINICRLVLILLWFVTIALRAIHLYKEARTGNFFHIKYVDTLPGSMFGDIVAKWAGQVCLIAAIFMLNKLQVRNKEPPPAPERNGQRENRVEKERLTNSEEGLTVVLVVPKGDLAAAPPALAQDMADNNDENNNKKDNNDDDDDGEGDKSSNNNNNSTNSNQGDNDDGNKNNNNDKLMLSSLHSRDITNTFTINTTTNNTTTTKHNNDSSNNDSNLFRTLTLQVRDDPHTMEMHDPPKSSLSNAHSLLFETKQGFERTPSFSAMSPVSAIWRTWSVDSKQPTRPPTGPHSPSVRAELDESDFRALCAGQHLEVTPGEQDDCGLGQVWEFEREVVGPAPHRPAPSQSEEQQGPQPSRESTDSTALTNPELQGQQFPCSVVWNSTTAPTQEEDLQPFDQHQPDCSESLEAMPALHSSSSASATPSPTQSGQIEPHGFFSPLEAMFALHNSSSASATPSPTQSSQIELHGFFPPLEAPSTTPRPPQPPSPHNPAELNHTASFPQTRLLP